MRATIRCVSERERERERGKNCWNESGVFIIASLPLSLSLSLLCFYHFKMVWKFFDFLNDTPPMAAAVIVLTFGLFEKQHFIQNCLIAFFFCRFYYLQGSTYVTVIISGTQRSSYVFANHFIWRRDRTIETLTVVYCRVTYHADLLSFSIKALCNCG